MSGGTPFAAPPAVDPEPAYIAASAASQIVTTDHQTQTDNWFEDRSDKADSETAIVSPASLTLVNAFLDQLLFSFLASARSTSVAALRPAVSEVLKPRLAKDAISGADQELEEFLGGGEEEELSTFHNGLEPRGPWDLQLVWRRTRLRCMVYTRLGDMEEEDEEAHVKNECGAADEEGFRRLSRDFGIVSPAAAIFLTSTLEFVGEQVLMIAGEAAYARVASKRLKELGDDGSGSSEALRVVVEDSDMEKLAFNTTFGRLWRSWRKLVRTPSLLSGRTVSRDFGRGKGSLSPTSKPASRKASISEIDEATPQPGNNIRSPVPQILEKPSHTDLAQVTLNGEKTSNDQGQLAVQTHNGISTSREVSNRPHSMVFYSQPNFDPGDPDGIISTLPFSGIQRRRSSSLPALQPAPYVSPLNESFSRPSSLKHQSRSVLQAEENPLPIDSALGAPGNYATILGVHDSTLKLAHSSTFKSRPLQRLEGMSKGEFDRQMLELVRDIDSNAPAIPDSNPVHRDSYPKVLPSDLSATEMDGQTSDGAEVVPIDEFSQPNQPNNNDLYESTINYWRGGEGPLQEHAPVSFQQFSSRNNHGFVTRQMQGERPRTASGGKADQYGRIWEHQAPYFYLGPVASDTNQSAEVSESRSKDMQNGVLSSGHGSQANDNENGAPPLTPLRELMKAAHDTSDEADSLAPTREATKPEYISPDRFQSGDFTRAEAFSPRVASQAKLASKFSDLRSKLPAVNTGTERAAVQRVLPSPVSAREPLTPAPRTSSSSNRDLRQIHTSSSSTSQASQKLKGLVGRDSSDGRRPSTSRRSSEGSSSMISDKRSLRTPKADEAQRSFDQLIKSHETIQYTLTPQNMREMEAPDSPRWNPHRPIDTAEMADVSRTTGPDEQQRPWTNHSKVSFKGHNGLTANPTNIAKPTEPARPSPTGLNLIPTPAKIPSRPTTSHPHSGVAREARANNESTRDFADFLRSTGPNQPALAESPAQQQQKGPAVAAPKPINALPAVSRMATSQGPMNITKERPSSASQRTEPLPSKSPAMPTKFAGPVPPKNRTTKLQARDATVSREASSDLIDFIRQGPSGQGEGRLRLPRTGDPARPFGDTNGITRNINGRPSEGDNSRLSVASTQLSSVPSKSVHSVNSRTGLLETGSPTRDARHKASGSVESQHATRDEPLQAKRKQYRNKDPYATDVDSEGDDDPHVPPHNAESLIHFLNSVTPPPSPPATRSAFAGSAASSKSPAPPKNQYPSMRDRLTRNGTSGTKSKAVPKETPMGVPSITRGQSNARQPPGSSAQSRIPASHQTSVPTSPSRGRPETTYANSGNVIRNQTPQLPPLNPRETSPHLVSQVGRKMDSYKITQPTYAAHVDRERNGAARRSPVQHFQARGNREPDHGLSDLADFLKNSEPPTAPSKGEGPPVKVKEKESGFGRMFGRKKKSAQT